MLKTLRFIARHPLNRGQSLRAVGRFARWQLATRILPGPRIVPFVGDSVLAMERGMTGATGNWYCGLQEPADMAFVLHLLRADDHFLDVGANVGSFTVLAAGCAGSRATAIEPIPQTFRHLRRNVLVNDLADRVACHNLGAGARDETLRFTGGLDAANHVATGAAAQAPGTVAVPVRRIDDILGDDMPTLVKIDVEGWEAQVLDGMPRCLASPKLAAAVVELFDRDGTGPTRAERLMTAAGFRAVSYDPFARRLTEGQSGANAIFVRDIDRVAARVAAAPRFRLVNGEI